LIQLFLDQALPARAETLLRQRGWTVVHATTAGLAEAPDDEILRWCGEHGYIVITHDHGFHQMIALAEATGPSAIRIRLQGLDYEAIAALIDRVVKANGAALEAGALVSVLGTRVKVRKLPLHGTSE
jgi:predicted nuclease of predicted toxin-antitoxin system